MQDYYPETLGTLFFVNAPMIFTALWKVIKGMLDPATAKKIEIFGSSGFEAKLLELVEVIALLHESLHLRNLLLQLHTRPLALALDKAPLAVALLANLVKDAVAILPFDSAVGLASLAHDHLDHVLLGL